MMMKSRTSHQGKGASLVDPMRPAAVGCLCCKYSSTRLLDGCCAPAFAVKLWRRRWLSYSIIIFGMLESSGFRKCSTLLLFQSFPWRLCLCHCLCDCLCLCVRIFVRVWWADVMSFQKMYGLRGPSGLNMVNQAFIIVIAYRPRRRRRRRKNQG